MEINKLMPMTTSTLTRCDSALIFDEGRLSVISRLQSGHKSGPEVRLTARHNIE